MDIRQETHTFREWLRLGRQVQKGEKATGRSHKNEPTFTRSQTKMLTNKTNQNYG